MKILITGMASSHTQPSKNVSFFGTLAKNIESIYSVDWATPSVTWTKEFLDGYDAIFVGLIPPTSLGANKVYGAMHVINLMYESPKLHLVVDHQQLWQFKSSLGSIHKNVDSIFTEFYSKRKEYKIAKNPLVSAGIKNAATKLLFSAWPKTIYPELPWKNFSDVSGFLSNDPESKFIGLNLDSTLLVEPKNDVFARTDSWVVDHSSSTWAKKLEKLLVNSVVSMKDTPRSSDLDVFNRISTSFASIVVPQERGVGTWWTYRYIQSMNSLTPVISDWKDTSNLSEAWNILGSTLEELSIPDRLAIAQEQRDSYISAIPDRLEVIQSLEDILQKSKRGE